jgi:hypothetical protein
MYFYGENGCFRAANILRANIFAAASRGLSLNVGYFVALLSSSQNSLTAKYSLCK